MKYTIATVLIAIFMMASFSSAASIKWTGFAHNGIWGTSENWDGDKVPVAGDDVTIDVGAVQVTSQVNINSLTMGDVVSGTANLTVFSTFAVTTTAQVYQHGNIILDSGAAALSGTWTIQGGLVFSSGSVSGTVSVSGASDLSSKASKTINNGALQLTGSSKVGGVVTLSGNAAFDISGKSTWSGVSIMASSKSNASFDTTKGAVDMTGDIALQADGKMGALTIENGVNVTIYNTVSFANALNVPNNTWIMTIGSAVVATSLSGSGNFVAAGKSTSFGAQAFTGMIACQGQACAFSGKNSVNNLVLSSGSLKIAAACALSASIFSIGDGSVSNAGTATVDHLNFIGAGSITGSTIKAQNLYVKSTKSFNLHGAVVVSDNAAFDSTMISFGSSGMLHLASSSTSAISGPFTINGPPNAAGFSNNGKLTVSSSISSTNINLVGTGSWIVSGSQIKISGAELAAKQIQLTKNSGITGSHSCINVGAIAAGTVKAKIDTISFECSGSCTNVEAGCSPMPTDTFSFSG